jgi:hypothetical protein
MNESVFSKVNKLRHSRLSDPRGRTIVRCSAGASETSALMTICHRRAERALFPFVSGIALVYGNHGID